MTGKQQWLLWLTWSASLMVAAPVVSTTLSTIRPHDLSETHTVNLKPTDRSSETTR